MEQMQAMQSQMSQMILAIDCLESQVHEKLLSQPKLNLKNVSAMTLKNRKEIQGSDLVTLKGKDEEKIEKEFKEEDRNSKNSVVLLGPIIEVKTNPPHFSSRLEK